MSKELHESPKIIWLQIDPDGVGYGEWDTTDDATWCKDKINHSDVKYVRADGIEELERDITELGHAHAFAREERDEWKARAEFSYKQRDELEREIERKMSAAAFVLKERDALLADNARLREAMKEIRDDFDCDNDAHRYGATCRCCLAEKTLAATPEQSLAAYRNKVIEECALEADRQSEDEPYGHAKFRCANIALELRAMKEPE